MVRPTFTNVVVFALSFGFGQILRDNPLLSGGAKRSITKRTRSQIFLEHPVLDAALNMHKEELGDDWTAHRNHCLRLLSFATHIVNTTKSDEDTTTTSPVTEREISIMALAVAYHDIALWTDQKLNYLNHSVAVMISDQHQCRSSNETSQLPSFTDAELEIAATIIQQQSKFTSWVGPKDHLVNAVRIGNWCDLTMGVLDKGVAKDILLAAYNITPAAGFHRRVLADRTEKCSPDSMLGRLDIFRILQW